MHLHFTPRGQEGGGRLFGDRNRASPPTGNAQVRVLVTFFVVHRVHGACVGKCASESSTLSENGIKKEENEKRGYKNKSADDGTFFLLGGDPVSPCELNAALCRRTGNAMHATPCMPRRGPPASNPRRTHGAPTPSSTPRPAGRHCSVATTTGCMAACTAWYGLRGPRRRGPPPLRCATRVARSKRSRGAFVPLCKAVDLCDADRGGMSWPARGLARKCHTLYDTGRLG